MMKGKEAPKIYESVKLDLFHPKTAQIVKLRNETDV